MVRGNDFLNAVFRHHDFVVRPQASVFKVLSLFIFELPGCWVEVVENLGVLTVILHPVVENGVGWGDEATNNVGDREYRYIEFLGLPVLMHSTQDFRNNVRLHGDVVNGKIELLESVEPSDLAGRRFCHGLEVFERGAVGVDDDLESM